MKYLILLILINLGSTYGAVILSVSAQIAFDSQLKIAVEREQPVRIIELLNKGADINSSSNGYFESAITIALRMRNIEIVKLLIENGASLKVISVQKFNLLHLLARASGERWTSIPELKEKISLLISFGLDINAQTVSGNTPLHVAMFHGGDPVVVEELLKADPNIEIKNKENLNVLEAARKRYILVYSKVPDQVDGVINRDQLNFARKFQLLAQEIEKLELIGKEVVREAVEYNLPLEVAEIVESYLVTQPKEIINSRRK